MDERLAMWRLKDLDVSARETGRLLNRDHHTVLRTLERQRGEDLMYELALHGRSDEAREMVKRMDSPELIETLEQLIPAVAEFHRQETEALSTLLPSLP